MKSWTKGSIGSKTLQSWKMEAQRLMMNIGVGTLHPQSSCRIMWDFASVLFLVFDIISIPLMLFVLRGDLGRLDLVPTLFWTCDLLVNFKTATFIDGKLEKRLKLCACRYLKGWFLPDLMVCLLDWSGYAVHQSILSSSSSIMRIMRVARCLRLCRCLKMHQKLDDLSMRVNSNALMLFFGITKLLLCLVLICHVIGCLWYYIGKTQEGGWVGEYTIHFAYWTAVHWALSQFHGSMEVAPGTPVERLFAVIVLFFGIAISSTLVSTITDLIIQLRLLRQKIMHQKRVLNSFLHTFNVSAPVTMNVKRFFQSVELIHNELEEDTVTCIFGILPTRVQEELYADAWGQILKEHALFSMLMIDHAACFRKVCTSIKRATFGPHSVIFEQGELSDHMIFIHSGIMWYTKEKASPIVRNRTTTSLQSGGSVDAKRVSGSCWLSEATLWTRDWTYKGGLLSTTLVFLLKLPPESMAASLTNFPEATYDLCLYAKRAIDVIAGHELTDFEVVLSEVPNKHAQDAQD